MANVFDFYVRDDRRIDFNPPEPIMQEDKDVAVWRFRIPKVLNQIDMTAWAWWFVYVNSKGHQYSESLTLSDDVDEPDTFSVAEYSIDYGISKHPGSFTFALEAINADQGGEIAGEWHTYTYTHKVVGTLQGNQAEYAETQSDIISALIQQIQQKYNALVGGATPLPVNLKSLMTDHDKVYLYTGTETGESTGYWYYYNGTQFVPGGLYGAGVQIDSTPTQGSTNAVQSGGVKSALDTLQAQIPQIDTTLSQSGQAADAKAVGDDLRQKETIINIELGYVFPEWEHGNISSGGESSTNLVARTNYIPFVAGQKLKVTFPDYFSLVRVLLYKAATYDNNSYITVVNLTSGQEYQFNNNGLQYVRFRAVANNAVVDLGKTYEIIAQISSTGNTNVKISAIEADIQNIESDIQNIKDDVLTTSTGGKFNEYTVDADLTTGYVENTDGSFGSLDTYKRTGYVRIPSGTTQIIHTFPFSASGTDGWAVYDDDYNYITGGRTSSFKCESSYKYFAVSCRLSALTGDTVSINFSQMRLNDLGKKIVMLGDSIIGNYDGDDSVPAFLERYSNAQCYNCAFGGSTMGADLDYPHQYIEAFNGFKIVNAIVSGDYSEQLQAIADDPQYTELRANFAAHVATLQGMDWSTVDVVTLSFGTNDWGTRVVLDDSTDDHSTDTFTGAFRTAIETLLTAYPHIKVAVCAPIWRGIVTQSGVLDDDTDTSKATRQWYLNDYREKAKEVSDEYHALYIDAYQGINFNRFTWKIYFPLNDATHPNATGREAIAKKYAWCLASI